MIKILMIEDEASIRRILKVQLEQKGYQVIESETGAEGLAFAESLHPQLVILDLGLPDMPGLEVLQHLRAWSRVPVIILTATDDEETKVRLLESGADDYISKPFGPLEFLARVSVALRHHRNDQVATPIVEAGPISINLANRSVKKNGETLHLTTTEFALLAALAREFRNVVSQEDLLKTVWGPIGLDNPHYLRIYIAQLRKKLEEPGAAVPERIVTEPGMGYRLV